jgi:hypothetical protein
MAIKTFKEILENKGYRIDSNDRQIFENGSKFLAFFTSKWLFFSIKVFTHEF